MTHPEPRGPAESGLTLVEVVVAMVLLMIVALAFLPLVLQTSTAAARGATLTTASRMVGEQLEAVRAAPTTRCVDQAGAVVATTDDPRGGRFEARTAVVGGCTGASILQLSVWVTHSSSPTGPRLAEATTTLALEAS